VAARNTADDADKNFLKADPISKNYFFLYPAGHFGAVPETFLVSLPFTQVMVDDPADEDEPELASFA